VCLTVGLGDQFVGVYLVVVAQPQCGVDVAGELLTSALCGLFCGLACGFLPLDAVLGGFLAKLLDVLAGEGLLGGLLR
jgi:hypothetical protein